MGSFNVACGISRISLGCGMPAALVPLTPSRHYRSPGGAYLVSNEGIRHSFIPFTLPIFGTYDDYGRLGHIERDINVECIEKFYNCDIGAFVRTVCYGNDADGAEIAGIERPASMFIHREIYDDLASKVSTEGEGFETAYNQSYLNEYMLKRLGFVAGERNEERQRYHTPYTHPKINGLTLWSDGTWVEVEYKGKKVNEGFYNAKYLETFLVKKKLFVPPQIEKLKNISEYDVRFDEDLEEYNQKRSDFELLEALENLDTDNPLPPAAIEKMAEFGTKDPQLVVRVLQSLLRGMDPRSIFRFYDYLMERDKETFTKIYSGDVLNKPEFKKLMVNWKNVEHGMFFVNASYGPTWNGPQFGAYEATIRLAEKTAAICRAELAERKKYD